LTREKKEEAYGCCNGGKKKKKTYSLGGEKREKGCEVYRKEKKNGGKEADGPTIPRVKGGRHRRQTSRTIKKKKEDALVKVQREGGGRLSPPAK